MSQTRILRNGRSTDNGVRRNDERLTNNLESEDTRRRRRGEYDYTIHGATDFDRFGSGGNGDGNGKDDPSPAFGPLTGDEKRLKKVIKSAFSHEEAIENESDDPPFIILHPEVCKRAGGGVRALVLAWVVYWVSPAADGLPRAKPQRDSDFPSWLTPGLARIARLIGLDTSARNRASEKIVSRAVDYLVEIRVIEKLEPEFEEPSNPRDGRSWRRLDLRLTKSVWQKFKNSGVIPPAGEPGTGVKVWTADVRKLGANEAIVLGQLWYRCVVADSTFRVNGLDGQWFPCSYTHLSQQTGLTRDQLREALWGRKKRKTGQRHGLMKLGLIQVDHKMLGGNQTLHFRISPKARKVIQRTRGIEQ